MAVLSNKEIAHRINLIAQLMELHGENPFRVKNYSNAYLTLRKLEGDISKLSSEDMLKLPGIGSSVITILKEIIETGNIELLQSLQAKTPDGIIQMLSIKGLGPKKVLQIWKELEVETIGELYYACNENRLVTIKGFGEKLQKEIINKIEFFNSAQNKILWPQASKWAEEILEICLELFPNNSFNIVGDIRRMMPEVSSIELITNSNIEEVHNELEAIRNKEDEARRWQNIPINFIQGSITDLGTKLFTHSASNEFLALFPKPIKDYASEELLFEDLNLQFIPAECREGIIKLEDFEKDKRINIIEYSDIKGIVHNHTTYSDGLHTLQQMSEYVKENGYEYFVVSDHSKSAGYAGGLSVERVYQQMQEIDSLNMLNATNFHIFKSIESDILTDGSLDYENDVLKDFDLVIASIHSGMQMDEEKATQRIIKAIENPYTRILGHPTGRLLLARKGYPINYKKVIDACASNSVAIELNANPQRLDIDWTWIPYIIQKNVLVSINPDAHSMASIHYVENGVNVARKACLPKQLCLNAKDKTAFTNWVENK